MVIHLLRILLERDFGNMASSNMIINCPVTFEYVKYAKLIFGPDVTSLKGNLVMCKPASVVTNYIEIPW